MEHCTDFRQAGCNAFHQGQQLQGWLYWYLSGAAASVYPNVAAAAKWAVRTSIRSLVPAAAALAGAQLHKEEHL